MPHLNLRILSYNIHQGITVARNRLTLGTLKNSIVALKADIVILQEVAGNSLQSNLETAAKTGPYPVESQFENLADAVWPHSAYGKNAVFTSSFHGNAILSRFPIVRWDNHDITVEKLERRGILHAELEVAEGATFHILGTHFGLSYLERVRQANLLCDYVETRVPKNCPLLVAGDFNDWREKVAEILERRLDVCEAFRTENLRPAKTYPSFFPLFPLDRIFFRGFDLRSTRLLKGRPWTSFSDHLPLMADLTLDSADVEFLEGENDCRKEKDSAGEINA